MDKALLDHTVDQLFAAHNGPVRYQEGHRTSAPYPSETIIEKLLPRLRDVMFADYFQSEQHRENVQVGSVSSRIRLPAGSEMLLEPFRRLSIHEFW